MIDNFFSTGFPGQLHEALCKSISMIFVYMVHAKMAQLVECVTSNVNYLFLGIGGSNPTVYLYFFFSIFLFLFNFISFLFIFIIIF